jgi:hypothetical protein
MKPLVSIDHIEVYAGGLGHRKRLDVTVPNGPGLGVNLHRYKLTNHELSNKQEMGMWTDDPRCPNQMITQPKW